MSVASHRLSQRNSFWGNFSQSWFVTDAASNVVLMLIIMMKMKFMSWKRNCMMITVSCSLQPFVSLGIQALNSWEVHEVIPSVSWTRILVTPFPPSYVRVLLLSSQAFSPLLICYTRKERTSHLPKYQEKLFREDDVETRVEEGTLFYLTPWKYNNSRNKI